AGGTPGAWPRSWPRSRQCAPPAGDRAGPSRARAAPPPQLPQGEGHPFARPPRDGSIGPAGQIDAPRRSKVVLEPGAHVPRELPVFDGEVHLEVLAPRAII